MHTHAKQFEIQERDREIRRRNEGDRVPNKPERITNFLQQGHRSWCHILERFTQACIAEYGTMPYNCSMLGFTFRYCYSTLSEFKNLLEISLAKVFSQIATALLSPKHMLFMNGTEK
ncbi:hypothetical protein L1887_15424 [Cichorium endivia]|nr:hypothetical protein L1887_15424 [Cichorium endivia]